MSHLHQRVAVTGGSGLLGRYVVRELMADYVVSLIDLKPLPEEVAFVAADARNPRATAYDLRPTFDALGWEPRDHWDDHVARVIAAG